MEPTVAQATNTHNAAREAEGRNPRPDWAGLGRHHRESGGKRGVFVAWSFLTVMSVRGSSSLFLCVYRAHPTRLMTGVAGVELGLGSLEHFSFPVSFLGWVVCLLVCKKARAVIIAREAFRDYRTERDMAFAWMARAVRQESILCSNPSACCCLMRIMLVNTSV